MSQQRVLGLWRGISLTHRLYLALGILVSGAFLYFWLWGYPVEDASMLFAYSENIASGHGVVYNPGGERVDGASDLLLALVLAGLKYIGLPVEAGCALVNAVGLGFICIAIWKAWSVVAPRVRWASPAAVFVLCVSTPVFYFGATGFGTLFFAALVTAVALIAIQLDSPPQLRYLVLLGIAITVAGMDRVEGFFLGGAIVLASSVARKSLRVLVTPMVVSVALALAWFGWRWAYFGWPLPNPFYKKAGLSQGSLWSSVRYIGAFTAPWSLLLACGLAAKSSRRGALAVGVVVLGAWTAIWATISNEMNLAGRFQFPVVPVLAVLVPGIFLQFLDEALPKTVSSQSRFGARGLPLRMLMTLLVVTVAASTVLTGRAQIEGLQRIRSASFHQEVAEAFQAATSGGGRIVTTEAGMIAWKTDLEVLDLWGLNDKRIAHEGLLGAEELSKFQPDYLFSHPVNAKFAALGVSGADEESWAQMNALLFCFAQLNEFEPVAVWGKENDEDLWVIHARSDAPGRGRLVELLRSVKEDGRGPDFTATQLPFVKDCN